VRAAEHHLCFQLDLPEHSILLTSDPSILEQILRELLDNACKYTRPEGVVQVQVHPHPQHLEIWIGNTATIDPKGLSRLFDKFYRAQQTDPWRYQGTGLGLALVKRLVKRLQGEISVSSHENWTIFTLRIPYQLTA
jgi:signal transduction histidine kinase